VSETTARATADIPYQIKIDLSMNIPPQPVEANLYVRIAKGLAAIQTEASFSAFLNNRRPGGSDEERQLTVRLDRWGGFPLAIGGQGRRWSGYIGVLVVWRDD
jgi:hypothetical protein